MLGIFNTRMAITAIDSHGTDMVRVTKRNRLFAGFALPGCVGRVGDYLKKRPAKPADREHGYNKAGSR